MKTFYFVVLIMLFGCQSSNHKNASVRENNGSSLISCNNLPTSFKSYDDARTQIGSAQFAFTDVADASRSSWIRGAKYLSCDKSDGFLIISTDRGLYIHQNVPLNIWYAFKSANSLGSYYNSNLKGRYQLRLGYN